MELLTRDLSRRGAEPGPQPTAGWCQPTRAGTTMTGCHPKSRSLHEPMADPTERLPPDPTTDTDLVEYLVVVIPDLDALRTVIPALADLVAGATIRILDLVCVTRSRVDHALTVVEFEEVEGITALHSVDGEVGGLLSERDIETASRPIAPGSSAVVLVVEDRWAEGLSQAAKRAGGQ